jgi:Holliday junction resolvase
VTLARRNPKRDANEADIVMALESLGFHVTRLSGDGVPDLLLSRNYAWSVAEVKSDKGRLTVAQRRFHEMAKASVPVFRSISDAVIWSGTRP